MSTFVVEPGLPSDPLAPSEGAAWAVARHNAVAALAIDERVLGLLAALASLEELLAEADYQVISSELIDEAELELVDEDPDSVAEAFVRAESTTLEQMASSETIVLSGPEVKRRIRLKQSIMPSHMASGLYDDVRALFEIGDREGALISLERLVVVAPLSPEILGFLAHNEERLLEYYQGVFGPFTRVPALAPGEHRMPPSYYALEKIKIVSDLIDSRRNVAQIIEASGLSQIEACAVLSQLVRASALDVGQA
jgi:Asp-tRNA(Asn)/Glu-tRNA(Gln) amidotransferase A subunit family amidase